MTTPGGASDSADADGARGSRLPRTLALAVVVIAVDQLTKWWAESALVPGAATPLLGEFLQWRLVYNPGAAFGIGADFTWVLTVAAAIGVLGLTVLATRVRRTSWMIAVGLMLGGAASHLGDRLVREPGVGRGHIVDFIDYNGFFVGNVADIALVCGAALLVLLSLFEGRRSRHPDEASGG